MLMGGLAWHTAQKGGVMDEIDWVQDPTHHDMFIDANSAPVVATCAEGVYSYGHFGFPCSTFSPINVLAGRKKRPRMEPYGHAGLDDGTRAELARVDRLLRTVIMMATGIVDAGGEVTFENVIDRGDPSLGPGIYWPARADMCPLALMPEMLAFIAYARLELLHTPMCAWADSLPAPQKWVTFFATPRAARILRARGVGVLGCDGHGADGHAPTVGRDAAGVPNAAKTAAYHPRLNGALADVATREVWSTAADDDGIPDPTGVRGGQETEPGAEISFGSALHPAVRAAVEDQRREPIRFASFRKRTPVPLEDRWRQPMPQPHPDRPSWATERPDETWTVTEGGEDDERPASWQEGAARPSRPSGGIPGAPPGRVTAEMIWIEFPRESREVQEHFPDATGSCRVGYRLIMGFQEAAMAAALALERGEKPVGPAMVVVPAAYKEPWAREWLLDTRDPTDVVIVRRSTRDTLFPGEKQADRAKLRAVAAELDWQSVDPDILGQAGEGGLETRSACGRYTVLEWHHGGVRIQFEEAHAVSATEYGEDWLIGPFATYPPFEPCRGLPHNVLMQERAKPDESGNLVRFLKPRVLTDESAGPTLSRAEGAHPASRPPRDSVNAGVARLDRAVTMPTAQSDAASSAIADGICARAAGRAGAQRRWRALKYAIDLMSAYRFYLMQRADWWQQVTYWVIRREGQAPLVGWFIDPRLLFGGSFGPNRFNRLAIIKRAWVIRRQAAFDRQHPLPAEIRAVLTERAALQERGLLPKGDAQVVAGHLQVFLDDETGSATDDPVPSPSGVNMSNPLGPRYIDVGGFLRATAASGARPAAEGTRVVAHVCIAIDSALRMGLAVADKTQCGDAIVVLGLRGDVERDRLDCPPPKAQVMLAELNDMHRRVLDGVRLDRRMVERNVGRLCNYSQVDPSVLFMIHAGYAIAAAKRSWQSGGRRRAATLDMVPVVQTTGRVGSQFVQMVEQGVESLEAERGVPMLPEPLFEPTESPGHLTTQSDASGEDGLGGMAFLAERQKEVWVVHSPWPTDILLAIKAAARGRAEKAIDPQPECSMPVCELFTAWAVGETVAEEEAVGCTTAVLDCKPAAIALTAAKSKSPLVRAVLQLVRAAREQHMGVHVHRELNTDADRLSHPHLVETVVAAARAAGLRVHQREILPRCFDQLRAAIAHLFANAPDPGA